MKREAFSCCEDELKWGAQRCCCHVWCAMLIIRMNVNKKKGFVSVGSGYEKKNGRFSDWNDII